ncbi:Hypothetical protein SCF082_LOCUS13854 [Durusdinium trenchii]|uniref:Uncharacterized protein n=1 Tax=Durusdinium trenchii TaxID=1381693 RepID=A0ABP0JV08_9DINO
MVLGANAKARDKNGTTMLHAACRSGSFLMVQELLKRDLPVDAADAAGWTPLHVAAMMGPRAFALAPAGEKRGLGYGCPGLRVDFWTIENCCGRSNFEPGENCGGVCPSIAGHLSIHSTRRCCGNCKRLSEEMYDFPLPENEPDDSEEQVGDTDAELQRLQSRRLGDYRWETLRQWRDSGDARQSLGRYLSLGRLLAQGNPHAHNKRGASPLEICSDLSTREAAWMCNLLRALRNFAAKVSAAPDAALEVGCLWKALGLGGKLVTGRENMMVFTPMVEQLSKRDAMLRDRSRVQSARAERPGEVGEDPTATCEPFFVPRQPLFEDEAESVTVAVRGNVEADGGNGG